MFQFFANPFLLTGLAATALPFIAHLLSRRRWDHVEWGAMQFLDLSRKSRRRVQLEELLLLLIRARHQCALGFHFCFLCLCDFLCITALIVVH